jgi:hypothetical protein
VRPGAGVVLLGDFADPPLGVGGVVGSWGG